MNSPTLSATLACALLTAGCQPVSTPPNILASFGDAQISVADLDQYLLTLPESERQIPAGDRAGQHLEKHIRRLALVKILERADDDPNFDRSGREQWYRATALSELLSQNLAQTVELDPVVLQERVEVLAEQQRREPSLNFQHIYFQLRGLTPSEADALRAEAHSVAREAANPDNDFSELARTHSQSSNAASGGLVMNARASDLDSVSSGALAELAEGDVSGVIETRTGLHIFRLIRRLEPAPEVPGRNLASARSQLIGEGVAKSRAEILDEYRARYAGETETPPWDMGDWTIDEASLSRWLPDGATDEQKNVLLDRFLLAQAALDRELEPVGLTEQIQSRVQLEWLEYQFSQHRQEFAQNIEDAALRSFFDEHAELFVQPERYDLELIFLPQGKDSYAAQQRAEALVTELRDGRDFEAVAKELSTGPGATDGGRLGWLDPQGIARLGVHLMSIVQDLEHGQVSDPVYCTGRILSADPMLLRGGFAILKVNGHEAERPLEFEEAVESVRLRYAAAERERLDEELHDQLLAEAGFELIRIPTSDEFVR